MERILAFLQEAGVFYLATVDGDQPRLRPLGLCFEKDGHICFGVGDHKAVYRQLRENPRTEIVASRPDGHWLRYTGKAVFDPTLEEAALTAAPDLRNIYNAQTGHTLCVFYLEDASAVVIPVAGEGERLL